MLSQLLDGSLPSDFLLIQDDKAARGEILLNEFIKQNVKLQNITYLLSLESNPAMSKNIPIAENFYQYSIADYRTWLKDESGQMLKDINNPSKVLQQIQCKLKYESKTVIIIDSLSLFVLLYPTTCYKTVHRLLNNQASSGKQRQQVICLLHRDVLPKGESTLMMFEQMATTNLIIVQKDKKSQVVIKHRKTSGRVIQSVERFSMDKNGCLVISEIEKYKEKTSDKEDKMDWINNDITFKLELGEQEKRARSEVVLPYLKAGKQSRAAEIIYEPDIGDDWDEEDPDDDLNI